MQKTQLQMVVAYACVQYCTLATFLALINLNLSELRTTTGGMYNILLFMLFGIRNFIQKSRRFIEPSIPDFLPFRYLNNLILHAAGSMPLPLLRSIYYYFCPILDRVIKQASLLRRRPIAKI